MNESVAKGYLQENFRLFHLKDRRAQSVEPHYHEFDKLVLLFSGAVDYTIEGVCYRMQPGDLLFVRHHDIHCSASSPGSDYDRIVLWIAPDFLEQCSFPGEPLEQCFERASETRNCLCRPDSETALRLRRTAQALERALAEGAFGRETLAYACFLQLMVECSRCALGGQPETAGDVDPKIDGVLRHINTHLDDELSVENLASMCYLSRYYFMRRFKDATGDTVHNYVRQKRLAAALERMEEGMNVTDAALDVGFTEYSAFLRAFRQTFSASPREYFRRKTQMTGDYRE